MASITKHRDNDGNLVYKVTVSAGRKRGKVTRTWRPSDTWNAKTIQRELNKYAAQLEEEFKNGRVDNLKASKERARLQAIEDAKIKTLRAYIDGVYLPAKQITVTPKTYHSYRRIIDTYVMPSLGDIPICDITAAQITKLLYEHQRGHAYATTAKLRVIMSGIFQMAYIDDSIKANPMFKVQRLKRRKDEHIPDDNNKAFTVDELSYILQCARNEPLTWQAYINLVADTGIRRGEACALQWEDIDGDNLSVTVRRNLQYVPHEGVYISTPKNGKARIVDIGDDTLVLLRRLRQEQAGRCLTKWVFTQDGSSEPLHPDSISTYFKRFGARYGIKGFHPHKLRHTSASVAITNGADVISVSQRLGHSDPAVTLRMYAHANEDSIRKAGQVVRDAVKAAKAQ